MKFIAKSKCQVDGHIYETGEIVETDNPSPRMLEAFVKARDTVSPADDSEKNRQVAGMTRDEYRLKLDQMGIRYKKNAKAEELLQILVEAGRHPMAEFDDPDAAKEAAPMAEFDNPDAAKEAAPKLDLDGGKA